MSLSLNTILLVWVLVLYVCSVNSNPLPGDKSNKKSKYNERESGATYAPIGEDMEHQDTMQVIRSLHKESKPANYNNIQQQKEIYPKVKELSLKEKNRLMDLKVKDISGNDLEEKQRVTRKAYHENADDPTSRYYQIETPIGSGSLVLDLHLKMEPPSAPSQDCCCEPEPEDNKENCWKVDGRWQCLVTTPVEDCFD